MQVISLDGQHSHVYIVFKSNRQTSKLTHPVYSNTWYSSNAWPSADHMWTSTLDSLAKYVAWLSFLVVVKLLDSIKFKWVTHSLGLLSRYWTIVFLHYNPSAMGTTEKNIDNALTHWGRVTHICVSNLTIIGSDNGLSPDRRKAIICTNAGILLIGPLGTNFSENLFGIPTFSFKKLHLKTSSAK